MNKVLDMSHTVWQKYPTILHHNKQLIKIYFKFSSSLPSERSVACHTVYVILFVCVHVQKTRYNVCMVVVCGVRFFCGPLFDIILCARRTYMYPVRFGFNWKWSGKILD